MTIDTQDPETGLNEKRRCSTVVRPKSHSLVASRPVYHGKGRRAVGQHPIRRIHRGRSKGHKYLGTMELKLSQETTSGAWKHSCCRSGNSQQWGITWVCNDIEGLYHSLFHSPVVAIRMVQQPTFYGDDEASRW